MLKRLHYNIEEKIKNYILYHLHEIKLFFILFIISIVIYGQKLFFYTLASDDFARYYSGGGEQASWLGRWMAGFFNQNIFTGALHVLPYFNGLLGIFSLTLSAFLTAKYLKRTNTFEIVVITLLITITPFLAHNFYFNTNTSTWITTLFGVLGLVLAYKPSKITKFIGFALLVIAIGSYQTIIQVTLVMIIVKTIIDIMEAKDLKQIKNILLKAFLYVGFVMLAFVASTIINYLYIEYNHLTIRGRYQKSEVASTLSVYIDRIMAMYKNTYNTAFGLKYFTSQLSFLYKLMTIFSIVGVIFSLVRNNVHTKTKVSSALLLALLFLSVPLIINLPLITGNGIPTRAHYTIGWLIAGFFVIQMISFREVFKTIGTIVAVSIIVVSTYYINIFYDAGSRQTTSDITRVNQIVNRIRTDKNYLTEPMKFKIVGEKAFPVIGWKSSQQALNTDWSKYAVFKNFTDFKYIEMKDSEYNEIKEYIVNKGEPIASYPGKNSIIVYKNKAILFLNSDTINREIKFSKLPDRKPDIKSNFNIYIEDKNLYYKKQFCTKENIKHTFFLQIYPVNKTDLRKARQMHGFVNMGFSFSSFGKMNENTCIAVRELPKYDILKLKTGQYQGSKRDWDVTYFFESNNTY